MSVKRHRVPGTSRSRRPATIVDWFEQNKPSGKPLVISEPSKIWVDRLWHILIRVVPAGIEKTERDLDEMEAAFEVYLHGIEEDERDLTRFAYLALLDFVSEAWDELPRCNGCGSILCPHCGRHANPEAPAA